MSQTSKTFCMHPFTGLATREDGAICACCRSHPVGFIQDARLEDIWNNDVMKRIRRQVLSDERPDECKPCFKAEDQGVESLRQRHIAGIIPEARINLYPNALDKLRDDYSMPFEVPSIELKLNNLCNLKCRMCHPMDSTSWNDWDQVEEFYKKTDNILFHIIEKYDLKNKPHLDKFQDNPDWWEDLGKLLPYFRRVEFAGGEPLMDPQHYRILDMLKPYGDNIELKYATNGTTLGIKGGRTVHEYWPHFRSVAVNVSLDGTDDVYNYIRGNSDWNKVVQNIREIQTIKNVRRIVGACTVQVSNILTLDKTIKYFLDELGIIFHSHRVMYPEVLSVQVLPKELQMLAITKLTSLKEEVASFKMIKETPGLLEYTLAQIQDNINYLTAKDESHLWKDCVEFNRRLDVTRKQSFTDVTPEFKPYI
jgi:sulfatase maturation enzyme AslB (radical SAM superfamily)